MPMNERTIVKYEKLLEIARKFEAEGEEMTLIFMNLRQRVQGMRAEWVGMGSDAFFDDMENRVLPSLQRLGKALSRTAEIALTIQETYRRAEEEGSSLFKTKLQGSGPTPTGVDVGLAGATGSGTVPTLTPDGKVPSGNKSMEKVSSKKSREKLPAGSKPKGLGKKKIK